jgi:hypothetical protein
MPRHQDKWNVQGDHKHVGEGTHKIEAYKLAITDQDKERRNFPGYKTYTPSEDLMTEVSHEGATQTRKGERQMAHKVKVGAEVQARHMHRKFS